MCEIWNELYTVRRRIFLQVSFTKYFPQTPPLSSPQKAEVRTLDGRPIAAMFVHDFNKVNFLIKIILPTSTT